MSDSERPPQPLDLTSSTSQKEAEAKGSAEKSAEVVESVPDKREEALQTAISSMHTAVGAKQAELTAAGRSLDVNIQQYLQQYFQNAIHRFDADKDGKISEQESQKFLDSMVTKTNEIVGGMIKAGKAAKKMEKAAEKAEKMDSQKVQASLESVQALSDLTDLEQANDELQKIQSQNEAFQQTVQTQLDSVQQFSKSFNEFQEAQEGFGHFAQLWDAVVNSTEHSMAIAGMKANLENTRVAVSNALNNLKEKQKILDANGEKIKAAFTKARQDIIRAREEKKAEVEKAKQEQADQIEARKQEYTRLEKEKKTLEDRRNQIAERQKKAEKIRTDWDKQGEEEKNANREANYKDEQEDIQAELHGFELILQNPNITQSVKDSIRDDYEKAKERQKTNELALNIIESKKKSGLEFEKNLNENERAVAQELRSADAHLARQRATELSMQQNIDRLKQIQLQYATSSKEVDTYYNKQIEILDKQTESVDDFVLNSSMARQQSITALEQANTSLAGLSVEAKGFSHFINPLEAVGSLSKGIGGALHSAAQSIDGWTRNVLNMTRNSEDTAEQMIYYGTQFLSIFSGFVSGGFELGGGIFTLAGGLGSDIGSIGTALMTWDSKKMHFETFAGVGAIIGYDAIKGEFSWEKVGDTWGAMLNAIVGRGENWGTHIDPVTGKEEQRDEYGTAIGKGIFNVLSLFVGGVGVGGAAAKGGATAARVGPIEKVIAFNRGLRFEGDLPEGYRVLNPYLDNPETMEIMGQFYHKYYHDHDRRGFIIGINPSRHGAGVTGVPFTDTKRLKNACGISMRSAHTHEISSVFFYDMIEQFGGAHAFYKKYYVNSPFPLALLRQTDDGKWLNANYYDDEEVFERVRNFMLDSLRKHIDIGLDTAEVYVLGKKNAAYINRLDSLEKMFGKITVLEHPRYIQQYKSKERQSYIDKYVLTLRKN